MYDARVLLCVWGFLYMHVSMNTLVESLTWRIRILQGNHKWCGTQYRPTRQYACVICNWNYVNNSASRHSSGGLTDKRCWDGRLGPCWNIEHDVRSVYARFTRKSVGRTNDQVLAIRHPPNVRRQRYFVACSLPMPIPVHCRVV